MSRLVDCLQGDPPANLLADDARPLRQCLVDLLSGCAGLEEEAGQLDLFLSTTEPGTALELWFGQSLAGRSRSDIKAAIDRDIARIDAMLSRQVDAILHHPRFQGLEAGWRGVVYLAAKAEPRSNIKVKVLDIRWPELCRDLERAKDLEQSQIFQKIYEGEFGIAGGEPFGLMLGDYHVRHRPGGGRTTDDVAGLSGMAQVAAAAFCPFVVAADPALFGLDSFDDISVYTDLVAPFRQAEYSRWRSFQATEEARFVGVVLPRVLMRLPYGDDPGRWDGFRYRENARDHHTHLWGNGAYAFGGVVMRAYGEYHWNADIRGVKTDADAGGLVVDLVEASFATDRAGVANKYPTSAYLTDQQESDLCEEGLLPLINCQYTPYSAFFSNASMQRVQAFDGSPASINSRMSAMLQYVLCVSRFAHYIKVMARDWVGSFLTADICETRLREWLMRYCTGNEDASFEMRAQYPLHEAQVEVREKPGAPGLLFATIHLKPHFQLDQIVSSFKLVTTLPGKSAT